MLKELRQSLLLHLLTADRGLSAADVLRMGTLGGAEILGRKNIGMIKPGAAADLILIDLNDIGYAGSKSDPLAAIVFCIGTQRVSWSIINGKIVVENGELKGVNLKEISDRADKISQEMISRSSKNSVT